VMLEASSGHRFDGQRRDVAAGEVQRMSAGSGVVQQRINRGAVPWRLVCRSGLNVQPTAARRPTSRTLRVGRRLEPCCSIRKAVQGAMALNRPVRLWRARPAAAPAGPAPRLAGQSWLQLIDGSVGSIPGRALERGRRPRLRGGS